MDDVAKYANMFKLWQFSLFASFCLLSLGFTGDIPFSTETLNSGQENMAIFVGMVFFVGTCVLKYLPPPEIRQRKDRPNVAISPTQMGLVLRFQEWTDFNVAALEATPDHKLSKLKLEVKNTELRIELATLQGIVMRRVQPDGTHQVKYRNGDSTTWVPSK